MLDLLLSLGRDHGKSILLSTHLLGDVEQVCDAVVILHQGRVLCQGACQGAVPPPAGPLPLADPGRPARLPGGACALKACRSSHDNGRGELRVAVPAGWTTRAFFALADNHGVVVRGLQRDDEDLEELFHRVIGEDPTSSSKCHDHSPRMIRTRERCTMVTSSLLHYRAWQGQFRRPVWGVWPIARVALGTAASPPAVLGAVRRRAAALPDVLLRPVPARLGRDADSGRRRSRSAS